MIKNNQLKLLCIFNGNRQAAFETAKMGVDPKTSFFGLYDFFTGTQGDITASALPRENYLRPASFGRYLRLISDVDVVIASYLSWLLVFGRIFHPKKKFILYNIDLSSVVSRSSNFKKHIIRFKLSFMSRVVCISHRQEDVLLSLGVAKSKLHFLPFGIDEDFFAKEMVQYRNLVPTVFFAVGADAARDYKTLLLAAAQLPHHRFLIECKEKNIPEGVPIPENVEILPMKPGVMKALVERYANSIAIVIPSLDEKKNVGSDCCGQTVLLEALACRKPVVASKRTWIREYFSEADPVLLFDAEDPQALADILRRTDFSTLVSPDFTLRYTEKNMAQDWRAFFQELMGAK